MTAHPTPPPPHAFHRAAVGTQRAANRALQVAGALGAGLLTLLALAFVAGEAGPIALLIGLFAALVPAPVYLALALRIDRYEPEPVGMLLGAFAWGATAAVVIALVVNTAVGLVVGAPSALRPVSCGLPASPRRSSRRSPRRASCSPSTSGAATS